MACDTHDRFPYYSSPYWGVFGVTDNTYSTYQGVILQSFVVWDLLDKVVFLFPNVRNSQRTKKMGSSPKVIRYYN